jgi:hypothetical protein
MSAGYKFVDAAAGHGPKYLDIGNLARHAARKNAAKPGAVRVIADKRKKAPRHRKPLRGDE